MNTQELFICFDDLERIDSALNIEDLAGYINSLVDAQVKVLVICNEDLLKNNENYKSLKEKIIGITLPYQAEPNTVVSSIINSRYAGSLAYKEFLNSSTLILSRITKACDYNYRHLTYALDTWQTCYSIIRNNILDVDHEIKTSLEQRLKNIAWNTLALAIEYKSSNLKYEDRDYYSNAFVDIISINTLSKTDDDNPESEEDDEARYRQFHRKYKIPRNAYKLFDSIFSYVTGNSEFDVLEFIEEYKKIYGWGDENTRPQYDPLKLLQYDNYLRLSTDNYRKHTMQAIEHAKNGEYLPTDYIHIMHLSERFDNPLDLDLDEVSDQLLEGLKKIIETSQDNVEFRRFLSSTFGLREISDPMKKLMDRGSELINNKRTQLEKDRFEGITQSLLKDPVKFQSEYEQENKFTSEVNKEPLFSYLKSADFISMIRKASNQTVAFFSEFFKDRYRHADSKEKEQLFISEVATGLQSYIESEDIDKLHKYFVRELKDVFESSM